MDEGDNAADVDAVATPSNGRDRYVNVFYVVVKNFNNKIICTDINKVKWTYHLDLHCIF